MSSPALSILQRLAAGDAAAADDCVREYSGLVWRLARRYLGVHSDEVNDGVQDVFVELWLSASRFDPAQGSEAAFVATIAHRRLIDAKRRLTSSRQRDGFPHPTPEILGSQRSTGASATKADREALRNMFNELPEAEREALWMSLFGGLSHREICIATEVPVGTVKSRLRRGLSKLLQAATSDDRALQGGGV